VTSIIGTRWSNPENVLGSEISNIIDTFYNVDIIETYKGVPVNTKTIILAADNGKIGNVRTHISGYPEFKVGDQVILFLVKNPIKSPLDFYPYKDSYKIFGFSQGVYFYDQVTSEYIFNKNIEGGTIDLAKFYDEVKYGLEEYPKIRKPDLTKEEIDAINNGSMGK
jgi:hypothetical protein